MMILMAYVLMLFLFRQMVHKTPRPNPPEQVWMCNRIFAPTTPAPYGCQVFDSCLYYLDFWEPIHKGDTIQSVSLDFVPVFRIQ